MFWRLIFPPICVFLQMFEGKENHLDLIHELRTVHALQREEQELQKADKGLVMSLKKQRDKHRHEVKHRKHWHVLQTPNNLISPLSPPLLELSRGGVPGQSGRCRAWTYIRHLVQGADSSPGRAQDTCFYTPGWERPSHARGWGEREETGGGAQTQRRRWDFPTSAYTGQF